MRKNGVLAIALLLIGGIFIFSACENNVSPGVEEAFNVIQDVSAVQGAQNASMDLQTVQTGTVNFSVDLSEIESNSLIQSGIKEAWCIEWGVQETKGKQEGVKLYSTKGKQGWNEVNYFLNIKDNLIKSDPDLTWKEIQVVIWSLVQFKPFDVDKMAEYEIGPAFYKDGDYQFDVQKVKNIISQVKTAVSSSKLKGDINYNVSAVIVENDGQTVLVEGDETFWAYGEAYNFRCDDNSGQQWGWAYDFTNSDPNSQTTPLVAGAGQSECPDNSVEDAGGTIVGEVTIDRTGDILTITLSVTPNTNYVIDVVHIDVDDVLQDLVTRINNDGDNVPPGQFPLQWSDDNNGEVATEVTFTVNLAENGLSAASNLYFAIHGVSATVTE